MVKVIVICGQQLFKVTSQTELCGNVQRTVN